MTRHFRTRRMRLLAVTLGVAVVGLMPHTGAAAQETLRPTGADPSGPVTTPMTPRIAPAALPASVDLTKWLPKTGDQGNVGSCTAWAITYSLMGWHSNRANRPGTPFAPMYTYSQINGGVDKGSSPTAAMTLAVTQGADTQENYTPGNYDWKTQPTAAQRRNASHYRLSSWRLLFRGSNQAGNVDTLKGELASGRPVAVMIPVRRGFDSMGTSTTSVNNDTTSTIRGWHEVLAVGYNSSGLLIQNSWGTNWGFAEDTAGGTVRGFGRLSWSVVRQDLHEAVSADGWAVTNQVPAASNTAMGLRAGQTHSRSVASLVSDPDGDAVTYVLVEQSFASSTFKFTWNASTGTFNMTIPSNQGSDGYLKFKAIDTTGGVSRIATVSLDYVL